MTVTTFSEIYSIFDFMDKIQIGARLVKPGVNTRGHLSWAGLSGVSVSQSLSICSEALLDWDVAEPTRGLYTSWRTMTSVTLLSYAASMRVSLTAQEGTLRQSGWTQAIAAQNLEILWITTLKRGNLIALQTSLNLFTHWTILTVGLHRA